MKQCVRMFLWDKLCGSSAQQEIYAQFGGTFRGLNAKGRSQPPARPNTSKLGRRRDLRVWGSVLEIHPEPTLKTEVARLHWSWRSNRAKMQAARFAVPVFNYWHFKQRKSVLSTQQEKIYLHFVWMQLVSSDQGLHKLLYNELYLNKVPVVCQQCSYISSETMYKQKGLNAYILHLLTWRDSLASVGGTFMLPSLVMKKVCLWYIKPINMYFHLWNLLNWW